MANKILQISSLGSKDPNNHQINTAFRLTDAIDSSKENPQLPSTTIKADWDAAPNHPIIQGFQSLFATPNKALDHPEVQTHLFDADNLVKGNAGIYREPQDGITPFGSDIDGKPLYAFSDMANNQNFDLGKNRLYTAGTMIQGLGAFHNEEEADKFAKFTAHAGDPTFMGAISGLSASGDKKGAVNLMMKEFGYPDIDNLDSHDDKKRAYGTAFSAYNYVENVDKMSPAQQSMSLSTIGMMSYKFKDGSTLADRALVKDPEGKTQYSLSDAFSLGGSGFDAMSVQKNWDQLHAVQQITYGNGTSSQVAATGKRTQLLGDPSMGGSAVYQSTADLGRIGFKAVPSAGMGAITGNGDALPANYEVVGAGEKPGQVIAVPKGLNYSTATLNGSSEIRSLNEADGIKKASIGAFKTYANQLPNKSQNDLRGTSFGVGLGQSGMLQDPYMHSALVTTSVMGNVVNKPKVSADNVGDLRKGLENTALNYETGGISGQAQKLDQSLTGGKVSQLRDKVDSLNPVNKVQDKIGAKVFNAADSAFGGKSESQQGRDAVRKLGTQSGLINKDDWSVSLSDGSTADVGKDGHAEGHQFRNPDKAVDEVRDLHPYDVDYTNDLDFSSNMMTSSLVRMMAGGKGTPIDQVAGQLGNAALGKVGYGKDMTEDNFNYVRDNVRGFYFKQGIQTKEDAYALSNQMVAQGRITEMDAVAMQQGINMTFDDNGFDTANVLMAGRWKGLETAANIPASPGPNYVLKPAARPKTDDVPLTELSTIEEQNTSDTQEPKASELEMNPGTYGGNTNTDIFTNSIIKYKDSWSIRNGNASR